jgi:hypothetical protein
MVELLRQPELTGLTHGVPHFSWIVRDQERRVLQAGFQIQVADAAESLTRDNGNCWDSGEPLFISGQAPDRRSTGIRYAGKPLRPERWYYWRVRTWNGKGVASGWSEIQSFRTGDFKEAWQTDCLPLEVTERSPEKRHELEDGGIFLDFGRAAFGTLRLEIKTDRDQELEIHLGEVRTDGNRVERSPGGSRRHRRIALAVRAGSHSYRVVIPPDERNTGPYAIRMPDNLFEVLPFRYAEIHGLSGPPDNLAAFQLMVHYPFDESQSAFRCSDEVLNEVWELCRYTMKATSFCGYYVNGDRERIPYEADAYINQLGHYTVDREYAMARRTHEYLLRYPTWPTEWILQSVLIAWNDYQYTGDPGPLKRHYRDLQARTLTALARPDGLITLENLTEAVHESIHFTGAARDQFPHGLRDIVDWPRSERDEFDDRPVNAVVNAFHYRALVLMKAISAALGKTEEAARYGKQADAVYAAFQRVFVDPGSGLVRDGEGSDHFSLHASMFALAFGLVPGEHRSRVLDHIRSRGMACSVYAAQFLLEALYAGDDPEYALELMRSTGERSWAHMVRDVGSTMTLEAWDDRFKPNQDWNHAWGAAPANIIPRFLMGIRPLEPGFGKILIHPRIAALDWAEITTPTIRGPVTLRLARTREGSLQMQCTIPANTTATVRLDLPPGTRTVILDGSNATEQVSNGRLELDPLGSGTHLLSCVR